MLVVDPIALRYQVGPAEYLAKECLLYGDQSRDAYRALWKDTLLFAALCVFGLVAALMASSWFLGLVFGTAMLARLTVPMDFEVRFNAGLNALAEKRVKRRDVSLRVDDVGFHEEVEGVRSFVPWEGVKTYSKVRGVLLLELAAGLWALIPEVAFLGAGAPSEAEFVSLLRTRGIADRTELLASEATIRERI